MSRLYALTAAALIVLMLGTLGYLLFFGPRSYGFGSCSETQVAGGDIGGPFTLVNEDGATVTDAEVITVPSLVYFGYTSCPDVCPLDAVRNADAVDLLAEQGIEVQPVFITIDPARDTPQVLREFTDNMHPRMLGLTGTQAQVDAAAAAYRVFAQRGAGGDAENYVMDHSTFTYLMLPDEGFIEFFNRDESAQEIADRTACFLG
ncbi:SCO family protein [Brevirhabdus sp.]|uniref:SCO family protein n=1 Tax=Brevirhabdus sp. TaxID=2004514 RepID=UPI004058E017